MNKLWRLQLQLFARCWYSSEYGYTQRGDNLPDDQHRDNSYLKRLPPEYYRGQAYVHWSLTIQDRRQGWLRPVFLYKFRELLTHSLYRYAICCPLFCLMPDHMHMMWMGILQGSDQLLAMKHFRTRLNVTLDCATPDTRLQDQAYDRVLMEDERKEHAFQEICEYIARNPERAGLVPIDGFASYKYSGCLVPGYPELKPFTDDYWTRFWRTYSFLGKNGLLRLKGLDT